MCQPVKGPRIIFNSALFCSKWVNDSNQGLIWAKWKPYPKGRVCHGISGDGAVAVHHQVWAAERPRPLLPRRPRQVLLPERIVHRPASPPRTLLYRVRHCNICCQLLDTVFPDMITLMGNGKTVTISNVVTEVKLVFGQFLYAETATISNLSRYSLSQLPRGSVFLILQ